jgi:hypothetical protein
MLNDKTHDTLIIVLKKAEVSIQPSQFVRKVGELSDLKELLLLHDPFLHPLPNDVT